jgi:hypothetical protein
MLRPNTLITITQQSNDAIPSGRTKTFTLDFVEHGEINTTWQNLTDTAKIIFPRNVYVDDGSGTPYQWGSFDGLKESSKNIYGDPANSTSLPLFMRGDKIKIELGYFFNTSLENTNETKIMTTVFEGYITKIKNRMPIELDCEDEMWKLKQITCVNKLYKNCIVQNMLKEMLAGTGIVIKDDVKGIETNIGDFRVQNETVGMVLNRLRDDAHLYSYFRGNELRCSGIVYFPEDRNTEIFNFQDQQNPGEGIIISDSLEYTRKEDLNIAVIAHSEFIESGNGLNQDGTAKTKRKRIQVMVGKDGEINAKDKFQGSTITIPVLGATTHKQLIDAAMNHFNKNYYTGFRGGFTTFGLPYVRHGDAAQIQDKVIPERDGVYLIKQVSTSFGLHGLRQHVLLHLRIDKGYTVAQLNAGI